MESRISTLMKGVRAVEETIVEPEQMTIAQWREHLDSIKKYSVENEMDYASAWTKGRTVFAIQGEFYVRPLQFRLIPHIKMNERELLELHENPGTSFIVVHQVN